MIGNDHHIQTLTQGSFGDGCIISGAIGVDGVDMEITNKFFHQVDFLVDMDGIISDV